MHIIQRAFIDGKFVETAGEKIDIIDPTTEAVIGTATLAGVDETRAAVSAAARAQITFSQSSKQERIDMLTRLHDAVLSHSDEVRDTIVEEYGGPLNRAQWVAAYAAQAFLDAADVLRDFDLVRTVGKAQVIMEPIGVSALIAPWNSAAGTMCSKVAMAVASGNASIVKPSEFSALQADIIAQAFSEAHLPAGVINVVTGRGAVVGAELSTNPDVRRISFTGSTAVGKIINRSATETMKRVHLALSGKSPTIILDDANLDEAVPMALNGIFYNNGQACIAGSRLLVPERMLPEITARIQAHMPKIVVGNPRNEAVVLGPLANEKQFTAVQTIISDAVNGGASVIAGGIGKPDGIENGYFVKPTVLGNVTNDDFIAREEVFGPVLVVLTYNGDENAIAIANDSDYGLQAYVLGDPAHARSVAGRINAGRVLINTLQNDPLAPFGGFKQSGIGREFGPLGLEANLEPKAILS
jgi:aldehyde dehydrogenase (NAD+)